MLRDDIRSSKLDFITIFKQSIHFYILVYSQLIYTKLIIDYY